MTADDIRAAISADPELSALAAARDDAEIARRLSAGRTKHVSTMVSARGLASRLGVIPAELVLMALEAARDAALTSAEPAQKVFGSALRRQLVFMSGDGIDFGAPAFLGMVDQLVSAGVWTQAQGASLKAISRVDDPVTDMQVTRAREGAV